MQRALQTTQPIGRSIELKPEVWVEIHEVGGLYDVNSVEGSKFCCSGLKREEINNGFQVISCLQKLLIRVGGTGMQK